MVINNNDSVGTQVFLENFDGSLSTLDELLNSTQPHKQIETDLNMCIAARIGDLLIESGKSVEDLAVLSNVEVSDIKDMLAGQIIFDVREIAKLTAFFEKPIIEVVGYEEKENFAKIRFVGSEYDFYVEFYNVSELEKTVQSLCDFFGIVISEKTKKIKQLSYFDGMVEHEKRHYGIVLDFEPQIKLLFIADNDEHAAKIVKSLPFEISYFFEGTN